MAAGDIKWFSKALLNLGTKLYNLTSDSLKLGIINSTVTPSLSTADPHWGGTGTTNLATNEVSTAGGYTGPIALTSVTWTEVSNVPTLRAANVTIPQNASGFTNGRWGVIYDDTDVNKRALGFVDLGAVTSIASASLTFDWAGASGDILTITQS